MHAVRVILFVFGYPVSIAVIARWVPVVRERRLRWFVIHQFAVAAIVTGWIISSSWSAVAINSTWLLVAAVWYALMSPSRRRRVDRGDGVQPTTDASGT
jgi:hypothetical protein